jgi:hypothetical protein
VKNKLLLPLFLFFFQFISAQDHIHKIYLTGQEFPSDDPSSLLRYIETQIVDYPTALAFMYYNELHFKNNQLFQAYDCTFMLKQPRTLSESDRLVEFVDIQPHKVWDIIKADSSSSYFGGVCPDSFVIPQPQFVAPFQYLGKLSKSAPQLSWLPFDLHLTAPLYNDFDTLILDYTDPNRPTIVNIEHLKSAGTSFEAFLTPTSMVEFERQPIAFGEPYQARPVLGHLGVPRWVQWPKIPSCPGSKHAMRFVGQIKYENGIQTRSTNVQTTKDFETYFQHLNFWGDGDLFIFFDPISKIACLFIQNT